MQKPTLKTNIGHFNVPNGTFALAVAGLFREFEWEVGLNINYKNLHRRQAPLALCVDTNNRLGWWGCDDEAPLLSTLEEVLDFVSKPDVVPPTLPKIGEFTTFADPNGLRVGCTFVPWSTLDEIVTLTKDYREALSPGAIRTSTGGSPPKQPTPKSNSK